MTIELHHFFVITEAGAPSADLVSNIGLTEGSSNRHPGQGSANRRFFFSNTTLELIYIHDAKEANHGRAKRLRLVERETDPKASPFGIIVENSGPPHETPFPGWPYCPEYFDEGQCFHVGDNSDLLEEPLCIGMPRDLPRSEVLTGPENPQWALTELSISAPVIRPSNVLEAVGQCDGISLRLNQPHRLELTFNHKKEGQSKDLGPSLPLVINW